MRTPVPIAVLLVLAAVVCASDLATFRSRHYAVHTNLDESEARRIATYMDTVHDEYARRLAAFHDTKQARFDLLLLAGQDDYLGALLERGVDATGSGGIFFVRDGDSGLATWVGGRGRPDMLSTLQHEGFHQFAYARLGNIPPWVNEGLAEYFGTAALVRGRFRTGQADAEVLSHLKRAIGDGTHFPFDELMNMTGAEWGGRVRAFDPRVGLMYDQSWSVVHFLINANGGRYAPLLESYLAEIKRGMQPPHAFTKVFGDDVEAFESAWRSHVIQLEPDALSTARLRLGFLAEGLRWLHENGIRPASIDELRDALRDREFRLKRGSHAGAELSAADDSLFTPPDSGTARPAELLLEASDPDTPPEIVVRGLRAVREIRLYWYRDSDGRLGYDLDYR